MKGACVCGRVTVEIASAPEYLNSCNCKFCRSSGAVWGYFSSDEVTVSGETRGYRREDLDDVWLENRFCPNCGTTTHYVFVEAHPRDRVGVNARLFPQDELEGIEVRYLDARAVETEDDEFVVTARGHIGDGKAF